MSAYTYSNKILCFGESIIRLSPPGNERIEQTNGLDLYIEGAETMAALSLASQGENVAFMTTMSDNRLAKRVVMTLAGAGIDVSRIDRVPGRMGVFYFERGAGERTATVLYDREDTPITHLKRSDFDWDSLLNGIGTFYFSGVLLTLGEELRGAVEDALVACKGRGIETCCDLNHRPRLWNRALAFDTWKRLLPYIDICVGSDEDIWHLFPRPGINPTRTTTSGFTEYYQDVAHDLIDRYGCQTVAVEIRSLSSSGIGRWSGLIVHDNQTCLTESHEVFSSEHSGCGDSFAAGVLHGIHQGWATSTIINYALMASVLKATIPGSINYLSSEEIIAAVGARSSLVDY